jgi:hypothetical protein
MFYADTIGLGPVCAGIERFSGEQGAQYWIPACSCASWPSAAACLPSGTKAGRPVKHSGRDHAMKVKSYAGPLDRRNRCRCGGRDATTGAIVTK